MRLNRSQLVLISLGGLLVLAGIFLFWDRFLELKNPPPSELGSNPYAELGLEEFFGVYWQRPIPIQGVAPPSFSEKEVSLGPESCGGCHPQQYADWKESLHSKAMGPGPWGQIIDLTENSPAEAVLCMTCHAPLSEQSPLLAKGSGDTGRQFVKNDRYDFQLQLRGITCAACHVRQHRRFGPPKNEAAGTKYPPEMPNHGGVERTPYFEGAEFCRDCHQFDPENTLLVNGKPLQDTYREWKESTWGKSGVSCQACHMPKRRHLWRGIHDREWVKDGVWVDARIVSSKSSPDTKMKVRIEVTNTAVGHKFPSYTTPKIFVRAVLLDEKGRSLPGTEQEGIIGWDTRFERGEWKEFFDTRISPGEKYQKSFEWAKTEKAKEVRAWVEVHPDHFYHVHFYPAYLRANNLSKEGRTLIERALQESGRTPYLLFEKLIPLS